jgi:hypothetical protein
MVDHAIRDEGHHERSKLSLNSSLSLCNALAPLGTKAIDNALLVMKCLGRRPTTRKEPMEPGMAHISTHDGEELSSLVVEQKRASLTQVRE